MVKLTTVGLFEEEDYVDGHSDGAVVVIGLLAKEGPGCELYLDQWNTVTAFK